MSTVILGFDGAEDDELELLSLDDEGVVELLAFEDDEELELFLDDDVEDLEVFCDTVFFEFGRTLLLTYTVDKIRIIIAIIKYVIELFLLTLFFLIDEIIRSIRFNTISNSETTKRDNIVASNITPLSYNKLNEIGNETIEANMFILLTNEILTNEIFLASDFLTGLLSLLPSTFIVISP